MKEVDFDQNGYLEFSEFCTAAISKKVLLSEKNLKCAFDTIDQDASGSISFDEVKKLFNLKTGEDCENEELSHMIKQIDEDGDGLISYKEFSDMMKVVAYTPKVNEKKFGFKRM